MSSRVWVFAALITSLLPASGRAQVDAGRRTPRELTDVEASGSVIERLNATPGKRSPVPAEAARNEALKLVHEVFAERYKDKSPRGRALLVQDLIKQLQAMKDEDVVGRLVMLTEARDTAMAIGDISNAAYLSQLMAEKYEVNESELLTEAVTKLAGRGEGQPAAEAATLGILVIEAAAARQDFPQAKKLMPTVRQLASVSHNPVVVSTIRDRLTRVESQGVECEKGTAAIAKLTANPNDPDANLAAGRYYLFTLGNPESAMTAFAKGNDAGYQAVAKLELAKPATVDDQKSVGDAWWDLAVKEKPNAVAADGCRARAAIWYGQAAPGLAGLAKAAVMQRLSTLPKAVAPVMPGAQPNTTTLSPAVITANAEPINDFKNWTSTDPGGNWSLAATRFHGEGTGRLDFKTPLPMDCTVSCRMKVISGLRPRICFKGISLCLGDLDGTREFKVEGVKVVEKSVFHYELQKEYLIEFKFNAETFEIAIDGMRRFSGTRSTAPISMQLYLRTGETDKPGSAEFWDLRLSTGTRASSGSNNGSPGFPAITAVPSDAKTEQTTAQRLGAIRAFRKGIGDTNANTQSPLDASAPLTGNVEWSANPSGYSLTNELILGVEGDRAAGRAEAAAHVVAQGGFMLEGGKLMVSKGSLDLHGEPNRPVVLKHVTILCKLGGSVKGSNVIFEDCTFTKAGASFVAYFSSKWDFSDCLMIHSNFKSLNKTDYGIKLERCTFVDCKIPGRPNKSKGDDTAKGMHTEWSHVADCEFYDCDISASVCWMLQRCNLLGSRAKDAASFSSPTDTTVELGLLNDDRGKLMSDLGALIANSETGKVTFTAATTLYTTNAFPSLVPGNTVGSTSGNVPARPPAVEPALRGSSIFDVPTGK